jgi:hypothetical protein
VERGTWNVEFLSVSTFRIPHSAFYVSPSILFLAPGLSFCPCPLSLPAGRDGTKSARHESTWLIWNGQIESKSYLICLILKALRRLWRASPVGQVQYAFESRIV